MSQPLFRADPGWLFVAAGLALCALGVLIPAEQDLATLRQQLRQIQAQEQYAYDRMLAYSQLLDELEEGDPALIRRLAASQLNLIPEDHRPILLTTSASANIADWADSTVEFRPPATPVQQSSALSRLASGPHRLWLFAAGVMSLFVGLIFGPDPVQEMLEEDEQGEAAAGAEAMFHVEPFAEVARTHEVARTDEARGPTDDHRWLPAGTAVTCIANESPIDDYLTLFQENAPEPLDRTVAVEHGSRKNVGPPPDDAATGETNDHDEDHKGIEQGSLMIEDHDNFDLYSDEEDDDSYDLVEGDDDDLDEDEDEDEWDEDLDDEEEEDDLDEDDELDDELDDDEEEDEYEYVDEEGNPIDPSELDDYDIEDEEVEGELDEEEDEDDEEDEVFDDED